MPHVLDILKERGFIAQTTFEDELYEQLKQPTTFYVGFDPTADSLHIGHYIPIMAMAHMQRAGHRPIALMGGGTAMIGDPSGKTDMRKMMTVETIDNNVAHIKEQMSRFLDFSDGKAIIANNGDWLRNLNFIEFMRDIGSLFSVNKMLTAECYKARMATDNGLSFLEFTYMLMQSYDFLELFHRYGCRLEMGGNDQWSNMLGGADLVRRKDNEKAFACTFQLLLTHDGRKMGKTEKGALWLDPNKTSPFDFYQYWRNVDDKDVEKCLGLLPFLPMMSVHLIFLNLIYDLCCTAIPWDNVDEEFIAKPRKWDASSVGSFMIWIGPTSSVFDFTTYIFMYFVFCPMFVSGGVLFHDLAAHYSGPELAAIQAQYIGMFQAGWFVESMWSQTLVIHMIRTPKIPFIQSHASAPVTLLTMAGIAVLTVIPFTAFGAALGFTALPAAYFAYLIPCILLYMVLATVLKKAYVRHHGELL